MLTSGPALAAADAQVQQAIDCAREHFEHEGYNCAESVLRGVAAALSLPVDEAILQLATPFGGGFGRAGCTCGALSGAMMALGVLLGRSRPDPDIRDRAYRHAQHVWQGFVERAGGEDCRDLNTLGFGHPDHKTLCARFVVIGAELAARELLQASAEIKHP